MKLFRNLLALLLAVNLMTGSLMPVFAAEAPISLLEAEEGMEVIDPEEPEEKEDQYIWVPYESISKKYVKNGTFDLEAEVWGGDVLTYKTSNKKVVTVSKSGIVTIVGTGSATITITAPESEEYNKATLTVKVTIGKKPMNLGYSSSYKKSKYYTALNKVTLTGSDAKDLVAVATSQVGYHEGKNSSSLGGTGSSKSNYTEYGRFAGINPVGWCSLFVNWCAREADVSPSAVPYATSTGSFYSFYHRSGQKFYSWSKVGKKSYQPKAGDIIFYSTSKNGSTSHMGIVVKSSYTSKKVKITTIEGNYSEKVTKRTMNLTRSGSGKANGMYILGVAHPKY